MPNVFSAKHSSAKIITVQANKTLIHDGSQDADGCKSRLVIVVFINFENKKYLRSSSNCPNVMGKNVWLTTSRRLFVCVWQITAKYSPYLFGQTYLVITLFVKYI